MPSKKTTEATPDLKNEILEVLKRSLRIEVKDGDFTDPNSRTIQVLFGKEVISSARFDVRSRREYEG